MFRVKTKCIYIGILGIAFSALGTPARLSASDDAVRQAEIDRYANEFVDLAKSSLTEGPKDFTKQRFLDLAIELHKKDLVRPVLQSFISISRRVPFAPKALRPGTKDEENDLVNQLADLIEAELIMQGRGKIKLPRPYFDWHEINKKVTATKVDPIFIPGNRVTILKNGPASFTERDRLIKNAATRIWILTWAFYDDDTGFEAARMIIDRFKAGIDVKIIVDGRIADRSDHDEVTKMIQDAGIPLIRWQHPAYPYHGSHRKIFIVDGASAITGGMNFGNEYSHRGKIVDKDKWRDTDMLIEGPAVAVAEKIFSRTWNRYFKLQGKPSPAKMIPEAPAKAMSPQGNIKLSFLDHDPTDASENIDRIFAWTVNAIHGAKTTVNINNAYTIFTEPLKDALLSALKRGVKVRIITNSAESVDEPIVVRPILISLIDLIEAGAEVYLRQGSTLHNKIFVVDEKIGWLGSYNLHPRSYRYEGESVAAFDDHGLADEFVRLCAEDAAEARKIKTIGDLNIPDVLMSRLGMRYFYDQL